MGKLWSIIEDWRDGMDFPPSYRQIALRLGVSQSTFDTWKDPDRLPDRRNLYAISTLTNRTFQDVVSAAIDDIQLFDETAARAALEAHQGSSTWNLELHRARQARHAREDAHGKWFVEVSDADDTLSPAALDTVEGLDEEPGGSDHDES